MPYGKPANDNEDPRVKLALKIARTLSFVIVVGLCLYLFRSYIAPS